MILFLLDLVCDLWGFFIHKKIVTEKGKLVLRVKLTMSPMLNREMIQSASHCVRLYKAQYRTGIVCIL